VKLFFDVDGVLTDGWHVDPALRRAWHIDLEKDLGVNVEDFERLLFATKEDGSVSLMYLCITGQLDLTIALQSILPSLGYTQSAESFMKYWFEHDAQFNRPLFDVIETLYSMPGIELYVATNQEHHRARYLWHDLGLKKYFRKLFYSAAVGYSKHDVRYFAHINQALEINVSESPPTFFDDRSDVIETALAVGWDGVIYNSLEDVTQHPEIQTRLSDQTVQ